MVKSQHSSKNGYNLIFVSCEECRHWGMICECEECVRRRHEDRVKHIHCMKNSRRLRHAWQMIKDEIDRTKEQLSHLTKEECGGDDELYVMTRRKLARKIAAMEQRFSYLGDLPVLFCNCDNQAGCVETMRQVAIRPMEEHDFFTRKTMALIGGDIARCAEGAPPTEAQLQEAERINTAPLNESCGEGCSRIVVWVSIRFLIGL